jgi:predicted membrane protein
VYKRQIQYRDNLPGGFISFGKAFTSGFLIVLISAIIASLYTYIFLVFIDPAYLQKIIEQSMDDAQAKMVAKGLSEEQMEPALAMTRKFLNPTFMSIIALVSSAIVGAILSLIAAAFLKKEDKSFDGQFKNEG